jgi:hypothetical protein
MFAAIPDIIDSNKRSVKLVLSQYSDHQPGDKVNVWWLKELSTPLPPPDIIGVPVDALPQELPVPDSLIEQVGDGGVKAVYVLVDKAGNYSPASQPLDVGVALGPWPTAFGPPVVDLAPIDQADVALGVDVDVPYFDNSKAEE